MAEPRRSARIRKQPAYLADYVCEGMGQSEEAHKWLEEEIISVERDIAVIISKIDNILSVKGSRTGLQKLIFRAFDRYKELENLVKNKLVYMKSDVKMRSIVKWCKDVERILENKQDAVTEYFDSREGETASQCGSDIEETKTQPDKTSTSKRSTDNAENTVEEKNVVIRHEPQREEPDEYLTPEPGNPEKIPVTPAVGFHNVKTSRIDDTKPDTVKQLPTPFCTSQTSRQREDDEQSNASTSTTSSTRSNRSRQAKIRAEIAELKVVREKELYETECKIREAQQQHTLKKLATEAEQAILEAKLYEDEEEEQQAISLPKPRMPLSSILDKYRRSVPIPTVVEELPTTKDERHEGIGPVKRIPQFWHPSPYKTSTPRDVEEIPNPLEEDDTELKKLFQGLAKPHLPKFEGKREKYHDWRAQFEVFVNMLKVPVRYKMIILKSLLTGYPAQLVQQLGYTQSQYDMALFKLDQRYGGEHRLIQQQIDSLTSLPPVEENNAKGLENLSNRLCDMVAKLRDYGREQELIGYSSLYSVIQQKIPEKTLVLYLETRDPKKDGLGTFAEWLNRQVCLRLEAYELTYKGKNKSTSKDNWKSRTNATQSSKAKDQKKNQRSNTSQANNTNTVQEETGAKPKTSCPLCQRPHIVAQCRTWKNSKVSKRWELAKNNHVCYRCLSTSHLANACKLEKECGIDGCKKTHHKDLHYKPLSEQQEDEKQKKSEASSAFGVTREGQVNVTRVALRLLPVRIIGTNGKTVTVNAFLDDGSDSSYLRKNVADQLGLTVKSSSLSISTLVEKIEVNSGLVACQIESLSGDLRRTIGVRTLDDICNGLPIPDWTQRKSDWNHLEDIEFNYLPGKKTVDLLIGSDHPELGLALEERIGQPGEPIARLTPLGWTCVGTLEATSQVTHTWTMCTQSQKTLSEQVDECFKRLWNMDLVEVSNQSSLSPDEKFALEQAKTSRKSVGDRYQIGIPWKEKRPKLPDNRSVAERRLRSLEGQLRKRPDVAEKYKTAFNANIEKGYIVKVSQETAQTPGWFLPHFAVYKEEKETTKVRIVYDSAVVFQGVSLNEKMLPGPKLQRDLVDIMMRFRKRPVALVGDIKEMFNQVVLAPEDRRYHRLLWRNLDPSLPMDTYEAVRLTFGDRSSPFLAQYILQEQARDRQEQFPLAADVLLNSVAVDDILDSFETSDITRQTREDLQNVLKPSGFMIRRWCSNDLSVLEGIPEEDRAVGVQIEDSSLPSLKTLGIWWDASKDEFTFRVPTTATHTVINSKRTLLSRIATTFDPFQFLAPLVIRGKILLQKTWLLGLEWDEVFPEELQKTTDEWIHQMQLVESFKLPRCYRNQGEEEIRETTVHTFVDASKLAYSAVSYLRFVFHDEKIHVAFVVAKARVTPLRAISIPRLELMGAVLGVRLATVVTEALRIPLSNHKFWTDSTDVLYWIHGRSKNYKPFVANRISEIHEKTTPSQWNHIAGKKNPADDATRGLNMEQLTQESRWFRGAEFLWTPEDSWPQQKLGRPEELSTEAHTEMHTDQQDKSTSHHAKIETATDSEISEFDVTRYSSWTKAVRILAWILRVGNIAKKKPVSSTLETKELDRAEIRILHQVQQTAFGETLQGLRSPSKSTKNDSLKDLCPFIDQNGLLRVGGRLQNSKLPYDAKHPIILPKEHHVTTLIIRKYHEAGKHSRGVNGVLADTRNKFWIVRGREAVKKYERTCIICQKSKKRACTQMMAPLPSQRILKPIRAFSSCGVDYGGPFIVKITRNVRDKRYLCLFTCNASRAVHLEVAFSLDTSGFLQAFSRMVARRGKPIEVVSDNGTNFVGAHKELSALLAAMDTTKIQDKMTSMGIRWKFNTPLASHHGGVFESMIKSAKRALRAILSEQNLRDEELLTAVVEVEGLLNSRPLGYCSSDPKDDAILTPNHFMYGQAGGQLAPHITDEIAFNPRNRWRYIQDLVAQVWKRWQKEYLHLLQQRGKWLKEAPNLQPGDVVMLTDQSNPRGKWPLARVEEVYPGKDGLVRTVKVLSNGKFYLRPITKLCTFE